MHKEVRMGSVGLHAKFDKLKGHGVRNKRIRVIHRLTGNTTTDSILLNVRIRDIDRVLIHQ